MCHQMLWRCGSPAAAPVGHWTSGDCNKHTASNEDDKGGDGFFAAVFPLNYPLSPCLILTVILYFFPPLFKNLPRKLSCDSRT